MPQPGAEAAEIVLGMEPANEGPAPSFLLSGALAKTPCQAPNLGYILLETTTDAPSTPRRNPLANGRGNTLHFHSIANMLMATGG